MERVVTYLTQHVRKKSARPKAEEEPRRYACQSPTCCKLAAELAVERAREQIKSSTLLLLIVAFVLCPLSLTLRQLQHIWGPCNLGCKGALLYWNSSLVEPSVLAGAGSGLFQCTGFPE